MSLRAIAFLGSTPIGGPIIGWIGDHIGPRYGVLTGGWPPFRRRDKSYEPFEDP